MLVICSVEKGYSCLVKNGYNFWPGYLVDFFPAQSSEEAKRKGDRYLVHLHAEGELTKRRKDVVFLVDDRIADCAVCVFSRSHLARLLLNGYVDYSKVGEIHVIPDSTVSDAETRSMTPGPSLSPNFGSLTRTEQLVIIRPHLAHVISDSYEPARWRNDLFYESTLRSNDCLQKEVRFGDFREREVSVVIIPELERWALRAERWLESNDRHVSIQESTQS